MTTLAGYSTGSSDGKSATGYFFNKPYGVAVSTSGTVYVADTLNNLIKVVSPIGMNVNIVS